MLEDLPTKKKRKKKKKNRERKERGDEPRFVPTKKRNKFNKHKMMRML